MLGQLDSSFTPFVLVVETDTSILTFLLKLNYFVLPDYIMTTQNGKQKMERYTKWKKMESKVCGSVLASL